MMEWKQKPGQTNEDFKQQKRNYYAKLYDKLTGRMSKSGYQDYVAKVKKTATFKTAYTLEQNIRSKSEHSISGVLGSLLQDLLEARSEIRRSREVEAPI